MLIHEQEDDVGIIMVSSDAAVPSYGLGFCVAHKLLPSVPPNIVLHFIYRKTSLHQIISWYLFEKKAIHVQFEKIDCPNVL